MNLEQVARRAKVSTATVSRVLNNATVVKTSTRARVVKAIEELKYHPNLHARNLAGGKSRTVGVIVSNLENPFFFDIYKTMEADAHARTRNLAATEDLGRHPAQQVRKKQWSCQFVPHRGERGMELAGRESGAPLRAPDQDFCGREGGI